MLNTIVGVLEREKQNGEALLYAVNRSLKANQKAGNAIFPSICVVSRYLLFSSNSEINQSRFAYVLQSYIFSHDLDL